MLQTLLEMGTPLKKSQTRKINQINCSVDTEQFKCQSTNEIFLIDSVDLGQLAVDSCWLSGSSFPGSS